MAGDQGHKEKATEKHRDSQQRCLRNFKAGKNVD